LVSIGPHCVAAIMNVLIRVIIIGSLGAVTTGVVLASRFLDLGAARNQGAAVAAAAVPNPAAPPAAAYSGRNVVLKPDDLGQFRVDVTVNGRVMNMLVDTGASFVALTQEDAIALGVMPVSFNTPLHTANGALRAGEARLNEIRVGSIAVRDTPAVVLPSGAMQHSLLGMSFLKKLAGFEFASGDLILKQ
jgi:aspartyl protease family protein